jgi:hypothetical protein
VAGAAIGGTQPIASDDLLTIGVRVKEILDEAKRMFKFGHVFEPADLLSRHCARAIG